MHILLYIYIFAILSRFALIRWRLLLRKTSLFQEGYLRSFLTLRKCSSTWKVSGTKQMLQINPRSKTFMSWLCSARLGLCCGGICHFWPQRVGRTSLVFGDVVGHFRTGFTASSTYLGYALNCQLETFLIEGEVPFLWHLMFNMRYRS